MTWNRHEDWKHLFYRRQAVKVFALMQEIIFIHINKTGGSSIALALGLPMQMHATATEIRNQIPAEQWAQAFKFAFVRNPWGKVVSHFHYRMQTNQTGLSNGSTSFNEWVKLAYAEKDPAFYDKPRFFMPQLNWVSDQSGALIVDHIGRFENIAEDFSEICRKLGVEKQLPHVRRSSHKHYRDYYSDASREIVYNWFIKDIEMFGYQF